MRRALAVLVLTGCSAHVAADSPADVAAIADRGKQMQVTETLPPPPTIRQTVNALTYQHYNDVPAMKAYRLVAAGRGWPSSRIEAWAPFVHDVMIGESAFCWNRRRGDTVAPYSVGCIITHQGTHDDVGFGQVTRSFYGSNGLLCTMYGVCASGQILASPYDSMLWSIVVPLELDGSGPWCYSARARSYHPACRWAPD